MLERTFAIIKPDAVERNLIGPILSMMEEAGLRVRALKMTHLTAEQAAGFYAVHRERPFFCELVTYMTSGPIVCLVLEGENAISRYRQLLGATDPAKAAEGTLRKTFALSMQSNSVHGSDGPETAAQEIIYFFSALEQVRS